jgi:hypothetical protein
MISLVIDLSPVGRCRRHHIATITTSSVIMEARSHRLFGRKTLCSGFIEVVAALGTGVSVILPSLMIGIESENRRRAARDFWRIDRRRAVVRQ